MTFLDSVHEADISTCTVRCTEHACNKSLSQGFEIVTLLLCVCVCWELSYFLYSSTKSVLFCLLLYYYVYCQFRYLTIYKRKKVHILYKQKETSDSVIFTISLCYITVPDQFVFS